MEWLLLFAKVIKLSEETLRVAAGSEATARRGSTTRIL
jgi:hypothetical protein